MNLCMEQKQIHGREERTCGCQGGGEGVGWTGVGVSRCKLLHLEWTGSEVLLDGTGT